MLHSILRICKCQRDKPTNKQTNERTIITMKFIWMLIIFWLDLKEIPIFLPYALMNLCVYLYVLLCARCFLFHSFCRKINPLVAAATFDFDTTTLSEKQTYFTTISSYYAEWIFERVKRETHKKQDLTSHVTLRFN